MQSRAQMELMGLAIIVLLLTLGILFALYFVLSAPPSKGTAGIQDTIMAANFLNTLSRTTTDCFDRDIKELLQDCARGGTINCAGSTYKGEALPPGDTCERAANLIQLLLTDTFDAMGKTYIFKGQGTTALDTMKFSSTGQCPQGQQPPCDCPGEKTSKTDPIPVGGFEIALTLDICS